MFASMRMNPYVIAACLLCGALVGRTAFAGPIQVSEISGKYNDATLISEGPFGNLPLTFSLTSGIVTGPPLFPAFNVPDENPVTVHQPSPPPTPTPPPSLSTLSFNLTLSPPSTEFVDFTISANSVTVAGSGSDFIEAEMTLNSYNLPGYNLSNFDTASLTLDFSLTGVNFDANWPASFTGPVPFSIDPVPEPASIVYLTWVGVFGAMGYWRRHRRKDEG